MYYTVLIIFSKLRQATHR